MPSTSTVVHREERFTYWHFRCPVANSWSHSPHLLLQSPPPPQALHLCKGSAPSANRSGLKITWNDGKMDLCPTSLTSADSDKCMFEISPIQTFSWLSSLTHWSTFLFSPAVGVASQVTSTVNPLDPYSIRQPEGSFDNAGQIMPFFCANPPEVSYLIQCKSHSL